MRRAAATEDMAAAVAVKSLGENNFTTSLNKPAKCHNNDRENSHWRIIIAVLCVHPILFFENCYSVLN